MGGALEMCGGFRGERLWDLRFQCYCLLVFTGFVRRCRCFSVDVFRTFGAFFR